jgi:hypothetical protein
MGRGFFVFTGTFCPIMDFFCRNGGFFLPFSGGYDTLFRLMQNGEEENNDGSTGIRQL